jgi:hypothetical protein
MLTRALRLVLFASTLAPASASADGITWTLNIATLTDGGNRLLRLQCRHQYLFA